MLKSTNKVDTNKYEVEVGITAEQFETAVQRTYQRRKNKIAIPGFRKGKVPRKMIEKMYGEAFFYEDAINDMLPFVLSEAMKEAGLTPVSRPEVDVTSLSKTEGVVLKAVFVCKPEVEVKDYKGIEVTKEVKEITDEDVEKEIERLRERQGRLVTVEDRKAQIGDTVIIDFEGFIDGKAFDGGKENNFELKLGSGYFIPGFEDQVADHETGEEFTINVTFPENYQMKELAGKPAEFRVKLHEIKAVELPDVDDEFVKDVSEFDTLDELKNDLRTKLTERAEKLAETDADNKLYETLIERTSAEVPVEMIDSKIDDLIKDYEYRLSMQGLTLDLYLSYSGMNKEDFRKSFEENARKQVMLRLAFEKIAELENLVPTDEQIEEEVVRIASQVGYSPADVKKLVSRDDITLDVKAALASNLVKENAKIS